MSKLIPVTLPSAVHDRWNIHLQAFAAQEQTDGCPPLSRQPRSEGRQIAMVLVPKKGFSHNTPIAKGQVRGPALFV
ncbi:hypothetical protein [Devosia sp. FKR38]|uniref:hypothetical protein n=1 Tax=Devosia sp. FKR38 TaxID=2562312 RepID=UPI0010C08799|nr:hypothetical protein [Devosia sp. FKR38]